MGYYSYTRKIEPQHVFAEALTVILAAVRTYTSSQRLWAASFCLAGLSGTEAKSRLRTDSQNCGKIQKVDLPILGSNTAMV